MHCNPIGQQAEYGSTVVPHVDMFDGSEHEPLTRTAQPGTMVWSSAWINAGQVEITAKMAAQADSESKAVFITSTERL